MRPIALVCVMLLAVFVALAAGPGRCASSRRRSLAADRQALLKIENEWLNVRNAGTLGRVLAPDFIHPVPAGVFLTKRENLEWFIKHPEPADIERHFENTKVRIYGNVGIVNGTVVARRRSKIWRTVFTDVFVYRRGRWQAVNAQENAVQSQR